MTITVEAETEVKFPFDYKELATRVITFTADHEQFPFEAEVNLLLVDNEAIHKINREYRNIDRPTDVLSFPLLSYDEAGNFDGIEASDDNFNPDTGEVMLGDIIISVDKVAEQADTYGHSEMREFAFLIVHSMLHLFGYDHMEPDEAAFMENKQKKILNELNISR